MTQGDSLDNLLRQARPQQAMQFDQLLAHSRVIHPASPAPLMGSVILQNAGTQAAIFPPVPPIQQLHVLGGLVQGGVSDDEEEPTGGEFMSYQVAASSPHMVFADLGSVIQDAFGDAVAGVQNAQFPKTVATWLLMWRLALRRLRLLRKRRHVTDALVPDGSGGIKKVPVISVSSLKRGDLKSLIQHIFDGVMNLTMTDAERDRVRDKIREISDLLDDPKSESDAIEKKMQELEGMLDALSVKRR